MKKIIFISIVSIILACNKKDINLEKEKLKNVDIEFSNLSKNEGMHKAFITYMHEDGVLLRPNSLPINKNALIEKYSKSSDSNFVLTWEPLFVDISKSCDLGYTYGVWTFLQDTIVAKGTYTTVWKLDNSDEWKFVLDIGNDGIK